MNLKEIERVVGMIQTHVFKNSNAYSAGMLKSHFKGSGLQFREHQIYVPGDDVRFIDWKLTARSPNVYIKTFEEERNIEIIVLLDLSHTLFYGFNEVSKFQAIIEITALLNLLAGQTHDLVRVVIWTDRTISLPPKNGQEGLTLLISVLEKLKLLDGKGRVINRFEDKVRFLSEEEKIAQIKAFLARRKEVIYLGDMSLIKDFKTWDKLLDKKNMHCFKIYSPVDKNSSRPFLLKARDPDSGAGKVIRLKKDDQSVFTKQRFKEIGVHERYLEKFVKELV